MFEQAVILYQQGRLPEADRLLGRILQRNAGDVGALHLAGVIARDTGRLPRAASLLGKAVRLAPNAAPLLDALAGVLNDLGQTKDALAHWDKAVQADPGFADAWVNRGALLKGAGRLDEAVASFDRALAIAPRFAEAHYNRALVLSALGDAGAALESCDKAIALMPGFAEGHVSRGTILAGLRRNEEAVAAFRQAIALRPNHAEAHYNLGTALLALSRAAEAVEAFDRAVALKPDHADAWHNRALALRDLNRPEEAIESQERVLALRPDYEFLAGDLVQSRLTVCYWPGFEPALATLVADIAKGKAVCTPFAALATVTDPVLQRRAAEIYTSAKFPPDDRLGPIGRSPGREKIRVGYFSADFRDHPVSHLTAGMLENHDRSRFHIVGYSFGPIDATTDGIKARFDEWFDVGSMSDLAVARLARDMGIDIAVDLGGHTALARTGIFAARAAPVQVSYIGYLGTMGADYIDYIIADRTMVPDAMRACFTEKIVYLPSFQANPLDRPVSEVPVSRADAGLPADGFVFCCFNNNFKILPAAFAAWTRILHAVPNSVLWIYVQGEAAGRNIRAAAVDAGLAPDRIVFAQRVPLPEYLSRLPLADLFLDTSPYNAGTTASDALWMGLPVLTWLGTTFSGRMGASLLTAAGLPETIAATAEDYEALAIALARDPARLAELKQKLGENRTTARLFDTQRFTRSIEEAYTAMIARARMGLQPDHVVMD